LPALDFFRAKSYNRKEKRKGEDMKYIVLDLEWNQARSRNQMVEKPVKLVGEIIQIGAVRLNDSFMPEAQFRMNVCPKFYPKMHGKVSRITGLTAKDLENGVPFPEAFLALSHFCGDDFCFLTWGPDDVPILRDNLLLYALDDTWIPDSFDLQVLFGMQIAKEKRQFSLEEATASLGEEAFRAHDALGDAIGTSHICRHLDMEEGLRDYARYAGEITQKPLEIKEIGISYPNRGVALSELSSTPVPCPLCEGYLLPEEAIPQNEHKYLSLATCTEGEEFLIRFKFIKNKKGQCLATREIFPLSPPLFSFYREKEMRWEKIKMAQREKSRRRRKKKKVIA